LYSTIQAKLGKDVPASTVDMVCSELVKRGYVKVAEKRVTYALPAR
jgi:DNA-binding IclR family transcriptional regulator